MFLYVYNTVPLIQHTYIGWSSLDISSALQKNGNGPLISDGLQVGMVMDRDPNGSSQNVKTLNKL
jgi:hypothetical protein